MRITVLSYASAVNNSIRILFIYNIYLIKFTNKVVLNLVSLGPLVYVRFFSLSSQSHISLYLLFIIIIIFFE